MFWGRDGGYVWYGSLIAQGTQDTAAQLLLQPQYTDNPQNKVAVRTFHASNAGKWFSHRCSEGETVVMLYMGLIALGTQDTTAHLLLQSQYTDNIILHVCEWVIKNALQSCSTFHAPNASKWFPHRCSEEEMVVTLWYGSLIAQGTQEAAAQFFLQPQYTDNPQNKVAVRTFHAPNASRWFPHNCS